MSESEFKIGDRVVISDLNEYNKHFNGLKGIIRTIDSSRIPYYLEFDDGGSGWVQTIEKIFEDTNVKRIVKPKIFKVVQKDCNNFIKDCETYEEAISTKPNAEKVYQIYELVAEVTSELKTSVKRIKQDVKKSVIKVKRSVKKRI